MEKPIPIVLDDVFAESRKKKGENKAHMAARNLGSMFQDSAAVHEGARTFTYFDQPTSKSFRGLLAGLLGPSQLLKQSAAAYYLINPHQYLVDTGKAASLCPGVLKFNPYLGLAPEDFGVNLRVEPLDLTVEDAGDMLETQVQTLEEDKCVTMFGEVFKDYESDFYSLARKDWAPSVNIKTAGLLPKMGSKLRSEPI